MNHLTDQLELLEQYEKLQRAIPRILEKEGLTKSAVYSEIDMHQVTFKTKINQAKFTVHELRRVVQAIHRLKPQQTLPYQR
jgi:predicted transcriptional regulator